MVPGRIAGDVREIQYMHQPVPLFDPQTAEKMDISAISRSVVTEQQSSGAPAFTSARPSQQGSAVNPSSRFIVINN